MHIIFTLQRCIRLVTIPPSRLAPCHLRGCFATSRRLRQHFCTREALRSGNKGILLLPPQLSLPLLGRWQAKPDGEGPLSRLRRQLPQRGSLKMQIKVYRCYYCTKQRSSSLPLEGKAFRNLFGPATKVCPYRHAKYVCSIHVRRKASLSNVIFIKNRG